MTRYFPSFLFCSNKSEINYFIVESSFNDSGNLCPKYIFESMT